MKSITKYIKIFFIILSARIGKELNLRLNLIVESLGSFCFFLLHLISFKFILDKFTFTEWGRGELWAMLFTFEIYTYSAFFVLWKGLVKTVDDISKGGLDAIIVKPASSRFISFLRSGGLHNLICICLGIVGLSVTIFRHKLGVNVLSILLYFVGIVSSLWIIHCLSVIFVSLNFKFGKIIGTSSAVFQIQEVYKYPSSLYRHSNLMIKFLIVPLSLLTTLPTASLLSKPVTLEMFVSYLLFLTVLSIASHLSWKTGLRHYSSASS